MTQLSFPKSLGWFVLGAVISGVATNLVGPVIAAVPQQQRLRFIETGSRSGGGGSLDFISDPKSGGCWLANFGNVGQVTAMATAPAAACN
jgi:hypothetical protein